MLSHGEWSLKAPRAPSAGRGCSFLFDSRIPFKAGWLFWRGESRAFLDRQHFFTFNICKAATLFSYLPLESFSDVCKDAISSSFSVPKGAERRDVAETQPCWWPGRCCYCFQQQQRRHWVPSGESLNLLCHNCSTCSSDNRLCHPSSSRGCFENVITGHLFDLFRKHSMPLAPRMRMPKFKLSYETTPNRNVSLLKETKGSQLKNARPKRHLEGLWDSQMKGFI